MRLPETLRIPLRLFRVIDAPPWLIPFATLLALLSYLFEGFGIYLLIPLLSVLGGGDELNAAMAASGSPVVARLSAIAEFFEGPNQVPILLGLIVGCIFLRAVATFASRASFQYIKHQFGYQLRTKMFHKFLYANEDYLQNQPSGSLLNIMTTEMWRMSEGVRETANLITRVCAVLVFFVMMLAISPSLMVIVVAGSSLIIGSAYLVTSRARRFGNRALAENTSLSARIQDGLGGLRTIRLFGRETHEFDRFEKAAVKVRRAFLKMELLNEVPQPMLLFLFACFVAALMLISGPDQFVALVVFLVLLQRMQPHATALIQARARMLNVGGPLDVVTGILNDESARPIEDGVLPAPKPQSCIRLENVRYSYPTTDTPALSDVSFEVPVGRTTALVGMSGAGKSTILSLICRQIDPDEGRVSVDGVSLRDLRLSEWRARIAVVPQDVYLFDASLRDNIAFGKLDADDAEIEEAARTAGASEFIANLPNGLDTRLGDRGSRLSGGQRQRIALARAIIRDPDLLILDEATNALDNLSEKMVREAIQRASAGRTVLIVAHRLANVLGADKIVVLEAGRVVEEGSPSELLKRAGPFSALVAAEKAPAA